MKANGLLIARRTSPDLAWFLHWPHLLPVSPLIKMHLLHCVSDTPDTLLSQVLGTCSLPGSFPKSSIARSLTCFTSAQMSPSQWVLPSPLLKLYHPTPSRGTPISLPCFISPHSTYLLVTYYVLEWINLFITCPPQRISDPWGQWFSPLLFPSATLVPWHIVGTQWTIVE